MALFIFPICLPWASLQQSLSPPSYRVISAQGPKGGSEDWQICTECKCQECNPHPCRTHRGCCDVPARSPGGLSHSQFPFPGLPNVPNHIRAPDRLSQLCRILSMTTDGKTVVFHQNTVGFSRNTVKMTPGRAIGARSGPDSRIPKIGIDPMDPHGSHLTRPPTDNHHFFTVIRPL